MDEEISKYRMSYNTRQQSKLKIDKCMDIEGGKNENNKTYDEL